MLENASNNCTILLAYFSVDISATEGQTLKQSLILRGTPVSRLVKCYSSHPSELLVRIHYFNVKDCLAFHVSKYFKNHNV